MNTSAPRLLTVIAVRVGNMVVTAAARAWEVALGGTASAFDNIVAYLRWRWRAAFEELRPHECDTMQKRRVHRESWLAELERHELELRAVPLTAGTAAREAREWTERVAAVEARYDVMREELRELRKTCTKMGSRVPSEKAMVERAPFARTAEQVAGLGHGCMEMSDVVDERGLGVLRNPDASSEPAVDATHELVLSRRRARKTGAAVVDGDRGEPAGPDAGRAAAVRQVCELQRDRPGLCRQMLAADPRAEGREIAPRGGAGALGVSRASFFCRLAGLGTQTEMAATSGTRIPSSAWPGFPATAEKVCGR